MSAKSEKETEKAFDSVFNNGDKEKRSPVPRPTEGNSEDTSSDSPQTGDNSSASTEQSSKIFKISNKFDYVPGDKLLFFDDFSQDYIGDFPSKWDTNAGGEVVTVNDSSEKWFQLIGGYGTYYEPILEDLPEEYTIEFDILVDGIDKQTSSVATLNVTLKDPGKYGNSATVEIPFCQYTAIGIRVSNSAERKTLLNNRITADVRQAVINQPHISIAVNKLRYRLWVNEKKYVDIPRMIPSSGVMQAIQFNLHSFKDGKERLFIRNFKIAEGGVDLRRKLIEEGAISTNGILFDSGLANIQPQSYGIIRQISQVLQQESSMRLTIIGHTDSDGGADANQSLSKKRADAVKKALTNVYNISADRLETDGKGESVPVGDNGTVDGKAQNRRVEFIKI